MPRLFRYFIFSIIFLSTVSGFSQDRCGTVKYNESKNLGRIFSRDQIFEDWIKSKATTLRSASTKRQKGPPYKIPVVVHVIHNGESIGTGTNISDAQVASQISVLNEDFRRLNSDASNTPAVFVPFAGSMDVEFALAKRDPEGLPTNGIVRVKGSKNGWTQADDYELKAQSYWPAEDYLNLWVVDLVDNLVGYAKYPESSLPGIDNPSTNRLTDGVVIWHRAFGSADDGNFDLSSTFNKGRTLTHELGHFFGLRHIWGDDSGSCDGDDYVSDTPKQAGNSSGCPTHPRSSCGTVNMFQNYMDYTADACMNLFTKEQITRMSTVLENSPRRASLLTSQGLDEPLFVQNDLGIKNVISPGEFHCSTSLTPSLELRNYGTNAVTTANVEFHVNGVLVETKSFNFNLPPLESTTVSFTPVDVTSGSNEVEFIITEVNGTTDQNPGNSNLNISFLVPVRESVPFSENFNSFPTKWTIRNPDGQKTWEHATAPRENATNKAMRLNLFDYDESYGEVDMLVSPVLDLTTAPVASVIFDYAYTRYLSSNDRLKVVIISDCESIEDGTVVFEQFGSALRTTNSVTGGFVPIGTQDWKRIFINISQFIGQANVQLAFVVISDWGNNMYLDNVSVVTTELEDVELQGIESPSFITCNANPTPVIVAQNIGTKDINSLTVTYTVNGVANQFVANNINASPGDEFRIEMPVLNLTQPSNTITISLVNPNGQTDQSPTNNSNTFTILVDQTVERIPTRQNFDAGIGAWKTFNPDAGENWELTNTNFNGSIYYNAHNNTSTNEISWLISPVLDFSAATEASFVFDCSYRQSAGRAESLHLYGSKDCGATFQIITIIDLPSEESQSAWAPISEEDWVQDIIVDLNEYAGESNVRIAFAVINGNGNNLFLDNLEFFVSDNPVLTVVTDTYNLYGYNFSNPPASNLQLTFNLDERSDVEYAIVDMMGKTLRRARLTDVLNQTYSLDTTNPLAAGTYLLRLRIGTRAFSERFLIVR